MAEEREAKDERRLPTANISRIMKKALADSKMSKDAKIAMQDCVAEFISFVTSEASDRLTLDKRRTITGDDVIDAIRALGFTAYVPELEQFLADCRKSQKASKTTGDEAEFVPKKAREDT